MIELRDVRLCLESSAGPVDILKGVDLSLPAGASVSISGPSGSGKSSLLAVLGGIDRATSGSVRVDGVELSEMDEDALAAFRLGRIGILFQAFHLIPSMTAIENVALPLELMRERGAFGRAREALVEVGLERRVDHYPSQLSGGEQQRVALARALIGRPRLLLADEPTGNLDQRTGSAVVDLIFDLADRNGMTLVLVTHDRALAARPERRLDMQDGRLDVVDEGTLRAVRQVGA